MDTAQLRRFVPGVAQLAGLPPITGLYATLIPLVALPIFPESTPAPPSHSKDDCKHGGWMDLGYPNQGQCIADANRGDDRRP